MVIYGLQQGRGCVRGSAWRSPPVPGMAPCPGSAAGSARASGCRRILLEHRGKQRLGAILSPRRRLQITHTSRPRSRERGAWRENVPCSNGQLCGLPWSRVATVWGLRYGLVTSSRVVRLQYRSVCYEYNLMASTAQDQTSVPEKAETLNVRQSHLRNNIGIQNGKQNTHTLPSFYWFPCFPKC